jgi:hypothetical protein
MTTSHPMSANELRRAIRLAEAGGLVLLNVALWLAYRRQRTQWRIEGAVARWENTRGRRRRPRRSPAPPTPR